MRSSRSGRIDAPAWLTAGPYAHRGLHGPGRPENSRAAFVAAIDAGFGIELDVRASRDGIAVVFHDKALMRTTGRAGPLAAHDAAALGEIALAGTSETIPSLAQVLAVVGTRAPLLIELKAGRRDARQLCRAVGAALDGHAGPAAVMSFNPEVGRWFARYRPQLPRGLVVTEQERRGLRGRIGRRLAMWRARPHFVACDIRDLPSALSRRVRARGLPVLTWTVRDAAQAAVAALHADQIIHEMPAR